MKKNDTFFGLNFTRDRSHLLVREKGLGLVRSADVARSAFVGAMEMAILFCPHNYEDSLLISGSRLTTFLVPSGRSVCKGGGYGVRCGDKNE